MIQMIAGHADPRVTTRYIHLSQSTLGEVANLASVIVPKPNPSATSLESAEGVVTQSDAVATAEKETPASNIVSIFKRAA
jgi:hypothetical protein